MKAPPKRPRIRMETDAVVRLDAMEAVLAYILNLIAQDRRPPNRTVAQALHGLVTPLMAEITRGDQQRRRAIIDVLAAALERPDLFVEDGAVSQRPVRPEE